MRLEPKNNKRFTVAQILGCLIFAAGAVILIVYFAQFGVQKVGEKIMRELASMPRLITGDDEEMVSYNKIMVSSNEGGEEEFVPERNFWQLKSTNPDIVAWLEIPDSPVDYPILHATKEEGKDYYLKKDYQKKNSNHGSIFVQTDTTADLSDTVTVIYGHNMKDGTMFGWISKLEDQNTATLHPYLYIYYPERTVKAELLACYSTDDQLVSQKFNNFKSAQDRMNYIYTFENKTPLSDIKETGIVNGKEKLITLSTCTNQGESRVLAQYAVIEVTGEPIPDGSEEGSTVSNPMFDLAP